VRDELTARFEARTATVGVIGMGYVGLPLALVFSEAGFTAVGFDIDPAKVEQLDRGESYIKHIGPERVCACRGTERFSATTDFSRLAECDAVLICVPTPLGKHREPDLSFVLDTTREIARTLRPGQLVVLESTTYPGTTDEEVLPLLEATGLETPRDFLLAFSPEREDPGNPDFDTRTIPKVVGGVNPESTQAAVALYAQALDTVVPVSHSRVAEAGKLLENIYRSVNIALVNELKVTFDRMGIDVWEVIEAARTKPFGFQAFYPGPGLGGHCIPLDPFYLSWKASEYGMWTRFINLAGEVNTRMPEWVVGKTVEALNAAGRSIKGARVLVLGLSYKADIDDDRESPSYEIIELLRERGAEVSYCDPYFPQARAGRKHDIGLESVPLAAEEFARYDAVLLATAHREFADPALYRDTLLVIDTRHVIDPAWGPEVVRA
jgi:UDP-N-acetyl-D-glucosamine dehydrogenase